MNNKKQSYYEKNKEKILKKQQEQRDKKYEGLIEGYDYICCKECGFRSSELATHIINKHNMTVEEYKEKHNVDSIKSQKAIDSVKGKNNPAFQHGGKYSPFSDKFIYADTTDKTELVEKVKQSKIENNSDTTKIEYWLKKTNGNVEEAEKLLSERQATFSLEKCVIKYGYEKGREVWLKRQEKWINTLCSKTPQEIKEINKKKSSKFNYEVLWNKELDIQGTFYILKLCNNFYKIGVTTLTLEKRYSSSIRKKVEVVLEINSTINHCFQIEQICKNKYKNNVINKEDKIENFGWTETFKDISIDRLIKDINVLLENKDTASQEFNKLLT